MFIQAMLPLLQLLAAFAAGVAIGLGYFTLLGRNLELYMAGAAVAGAALQAGRFLLVAAVLFGAVQFGAGALISCALGLLVGRYIVLRRAGKVE